jgi:hypothetical protein
MQFMMCQGSVYGKVHPPLRGNINRCHLGAGGEKGNKKGENLKEKGRKRNEKGITDVKSLK